MQLSVGQILYVQETGACHPLGDSPRHHSTLSSSLLAPRIILQAAYSVNILCWFSSIFLCNVCCPFRVQSCELLIALLFWLSLEETWHLASLISQKAARPSFKAKLLCSHPRQHWLYAYCKGSGSRFRLASDHCSAVNNIYNKAGTIHKLHVYSVLRFPFQIAQLIAECCSAIYLFRPHCQPSLAQTHYHFFSFLKTPVKAIRYFQVAKLLKDNGVSETCG